MISGMIKEVSRKRSMLHPSVSATISYLWMKKSAIEISDVIRNHLLKVCSHGREKYVSEFVSKSGLNTRFYLISHWYVWYGYPS